MFPRQVKERNARRRMDGEDSRIERVQVEVESKNDRFVIDTKNYSQQYSPFYNRRLAAMGTTLRQGASRKWGDAAPILTKIIDSEIMDLADGEKPKECVLIGTLFKEMKQRGSVLDAFQESNGLSALPQAPGNISAESDFLVLEDDSGRIALGGSILSHVGELTTGIVVAVKGCERTLGTFEVSEWLYHGDAAALISASRSSNENTTMEVEQEDPVYILLMSGLNVGSSKEKGLEMQMLFDFISGRLGSEEDVVKASRIARVVVAGDSVSQSDSADLGKDRYTSSKVQSELAAPVKRLDVLLAQVLGSCPVDLMPGKLDPVNVSLPQQALHTCLLPHSARFNSLSLTTNPYDIQLRMPGSKPQSSSSSSLAGGVVRVMGHSGQPVTDILRQTSCPDVAAEGVDDDGSNMVVAEGHVDDDASTNRRDLALRALKHTLQWGHLAPTAPDTLACYPFVDSDPFLVPLNAAEDPSAPHVLFAGNQSQFATELYAPDIIDGKSKTRLVCIPKFSKTQEVVLVNVNSPSLECHTMSFSQFADQPQTNTP